MTTVEWNCRLQYKAFKASPPGRISLVSSRIVSEASWLNLGSGLAVVVDPRGAFCDLEATGNIEISNCQEMLTCETSKTCTDRIETRFRPEKIFWNLTASNDLVIRLSELSPVSWLQLGNNPLFLGVDGQNLRMILFQGVVDDPDGEQEAAWLESIETREKMGIPHF